MALVFKGVCSVDPISNRLNPRPWRQLFNLAGRSLWPYIGSNETKARRLIKQMSSVMSAQFPRLSAQQIGKILMRTFFKALVAAASLALAPVAASALTVNPASNIADGQTGIDINAGPYLYSANFEDSDAAGVLTFEFVNNSASFKTVGAVFGTALQSVLNFSGGVVAAWGNGTFAMVPDTDPTGSFNVSTLLGAGVSDTLTTTFGDPTAIRSGGQGSINFTVAAVPVPAAGLLLIGALGGMAAMRRRKKAVAAAV
ncbi:VPLPA-CTERM sorting domain-containing protein [Jannaschia sp. AI_61]|uniref:VPLPA-CTERM sorting domain-containing protein n=1 Tax=Jannaschia sp. AI_61 TaxID=2829796 RepID=UPI00210267D5|nr:VPLPA-CTERM sorting domain-containing protein [Jannaschia sp. AI_61]